MLARTLDELQVYRKSLAACAAISALLEGQRMRTDFDLRAQLGSASCGAGEYRGGLRAANRSALCQVSVNRQRLLQRSARLAAVAHDRGHLGQAEKVDLTLKYEEIAKMLTGLIKYLRRCDRKQR